MKRPLTLLGAAALLATGVSPGAMPAGAEPVPGRTVHVAQTRNLPFCEIAPVAGKPAFAQFYNTTGASDCPSLLFEIIDANMLAARLGADWVYLNPRRHWMADQVWVNTAGETRDFDGVKATWIGRTEPFYLKEAMKWPFTPMEIRRDTKYLYEKGKPVFILRTPDGKAYVMQAFTAHVDRRLSMSTLPGLRSQLKLPPGWTFDMKTIDRDLTVETARAGGVARIIQDELNNTYEGCGFDPACNYVP